MRRRADRSTWRTLRTPTKAHTYAGVHCTVRITSHRSGWIDRLPPKLLACAFHTFISHARPCTCSTHARTTFFSVLLAPCMHAPRRCAFLVFLSCWKGQPREEKRFTPCVWSGYNTVAFRAMHMIESYVMGGTRKKASLTSWLTLCAR